MWYEKLAAKFGGAFSPRVVRLVVALAAAALVLWLFALVSGGPLIIGNALLWNLFLAALPLFFALLLSRRAHLEKRGPLSILWWVLWIAFFPNAPYMLTDLIHVQLFQYSFGFDTAPSRASWFGLVFIAAVVAVGCVCGYLSLYLLHSLLREKRGTMAGWLFCGGVSVLAGVGIYIGRFMRFNSWDLLQRPWALLQQVRERLGSHTFAFFLLFCGMTFAAYLLFYLCFDPAKGAPAKEE